MLQFLEGGYFLAIMAGIAVLGMVDKLLVRRLYKRLIKQSENINQAKNKFLKQLKQKYESNYRLYDGVNNNQLFLEKQINQYRFLGSSLRGIDNFSSQAPGIVVLLGIASSLALYLYHVSFELIVLHTCAGVILGIAAFMFDNLVDTAGCREILLIQLGDYIENTLANQLKRKERREDYVTVPVEEVEPEEALKSEQTQKDIEYLKRSLSQIAAGLEPEAEKLPPKKRLSAEEEQVIKDIIKEYLY